MNEFLMSSAYFGLFLTMGTYQLGGGIQRRAGREVRSLLMSCKVVL